MQGSGRGLQLIYFIFDLLYLNGKNVRDLPLLKRKALLRKLLPGDHPQLRYVDFVETTGEVMYQFAVSIGMEGIVAKKATSKYVAGTNSYWLKSKPKGSHDGFKRSLRKKAKEASRK